MDAPNPWVVNFNQSLFMVYAVKHILTVTEENYRKVYVHMMCSDKKGSVVRKYLTVVLVSV